MKEKPWSGRFQKSLHPEAERFNASIQFDARLYKQDIQGSIAHAQMLGKQNLISPEESQILINGLTHLKNELDSGNLQFNIAYEDIHRNIEALLEEKIGPLARKLHTARSRNDQVALDLRLFLRDEINLIISLLEENIKTLSTIANKQATTYLPGYTHLQRAQPVTLKQHLEAYKEMFTRDISRLESCLERMNFSPLGAGSLSGTSLNIDRKYTANTLSFTGIIQNTLDAVSDRDFALEFLSHASILAMHLSRLSEELILWASEEFSFINLDDAFATGSSLMPQKKNPDIPELIRGKTGRVYGNLIALLTTMKALPLAYNKDMQEDKEPIFDSIDTLKNSLRVLSPFLHSLTFNKEKMQASASKSYILATEIVDYLVSKNIKFRDAHEIASSLTLHAVQNQKYFNELSLETFKKFSEKFEADIFEFLTIESAIKRRQSNS